MSTMDSILLGEDAASDGKEVFVSKLMASIMKLTAASNVLPSTNDFEYHVSTDPLFLPAAQKISIDLLKIIHDLIRFVNPSIPLPSLAESYEDTSILYEAVVETLDNMLESSDLLLDALDPALQNKLSSSSSLAITAVSTDRNRLSRSSSSLDIPKPQLNFMHEIENSRDHPFYPKIRSKPHALVPLNLKELRCEDYMDQGDTDVYYGERKDEEDEEDEEEDVIRPLSFYAHPYEYELSSLKYTSNQLMDISALQLSMPPADQPFEYVDSEDELGRIVDELSGYKEIGIDLEHHSHRSFAGITCLIQLSTRDKDYVLDTIALRSKMHLLNDVFTDPSVVKVFHGCKHDIEWLQRDFGLYVVNCFDTYFAAKELRYPALSLAHLANVSCGVVMDKKYQLADWRLRPLTEEMISYAKNDTHYLLYIFDYMRKEIWRNIGQKGILSVLESSKALCMRRYEKDAFRPNGYKKLLNTRSGGVKLEMSADQEHALKRLWEWRDITARKNDESLSFIMTNRELLHISLSLPANETELLENNNVHMSDSIRTFAKVIIDIVNDQDAIHDSMTPVKFQLSKSSTNSTYIKSRLSHAFERRKAIKQSLGSEKTDHLPYVEDMIIDSEISSNTRWGEYGKLEGYSTIMSLKPFSFVPSDPTSLLKDTVNRKCINTPVIVDLSDPVSIASDDVLKKVNTAKEKIYHLISPAQSFNLSKDDHQRSMEECKDIVSIEVLREIEVKSEDPSPSQQADQKEDKKSTMHIEMGMDEVTTEVPLPLTDAFNISLPEVGKKRRRKGGKKTHYDSNAGRPQDSQGNVVKDTDPFNYNQLQDLSAVSSLLDEDSEAVKKASSRGGKQPKLKTKTKQQQQQQQNSVKKNPYFVKPS